MKFTAKFTALALTALAAGTFAFADAKGTEIMQKVHDINKPDFSQSQVIMTLVDKGGNKEVRQVLQYGYNKEAGAKETTSVVMDFKSPASIAGTRFLQEEIEETGKKKTENKFIYLPSLKSTRRVNSSEGSNSFMGTDATYDDMSTREVADDTHEFLGEESKTVGATTYAKCYKIQSTPVDPKSSQYKFRIAWIDDATTKPVYEELYDKNGKLLKILRVEKFENHEGFNVPMKTEYENVQTKHTTTIEVLKVLINRPIPERVFTQQFLSTGK